MIDATPSLLAAEKISVSALTSYLRATGWSMRPSRIDGIAILSKEIPGAESAVEFILPTVPGSEEEHRRIADALRTIEAVEERSLADIVDDVSRSEDREYRQALTGAPGALREEDAGRKG
jgi:hypothetical protein